MLSCTFCAEAYCRKSSLARTFLPPTTHTAQALDERSNEEFPLRSAPRIKYLVSILCCFSTHQKLYRENEPESKLQAEEDYYFCADDSFRRNELDSPVPRLQQTAVDQVCKAQSSSDKQELPSISTESTATAVDQVCSPSDKQETSLSGTASTATPVDPVCSSCDTEFPSFKPYPLCGKSSPLSLLLCSSIRAYNCIPVPPACFHQQHPTQPLASLALQSNLKTIF